MWLLGFMRFAARCIAQWLVAVILLPLPALGAVRFDAAVASPGSGGGALLNLTVGSGSNRFVLVAVAVPVTATLATPQFAGVPLAPEGWAQGSTCRVEVYGATAPPSGTNKVLVSVSPSSAHFAVGAVAYDGVDQALPTDDSSAQNSGSGASALGNALLSAGVQGIGFASLCATGSTIAATPGGGQNGRWNQVTGTLLGAGSDAPVLQLTWQLTATSTIDWAVASFPLRAAATPTPADGGAPDTGAIPVDAAMAPPRDALAPDQPPQLDALAPDQPPQPDALAPDQAPPAPDAPPGQSAPDAAPASRDAVLVAFPREPDAPDAAAPRAIDLVVTTGCTATGRAPPAPAPLTLAAVGLLVVLARRRRG
jgi:uncharacterized protein (TIGR03382 family)